MPSFNIHRMKDSARQQFRWAPHTIGASIAKLKDYEVAYTLEASGPYAVWMSLKDTDHPLEIGDILESESGELRIYKYVGFEEAQWQIPDLKIGMEPAPVAAAHPPTN